MLLTMSRIALGVTVLFISSSVFADSSLPKSQFGDANTLVLAQADTQSSGPNQGAPAGAAPNTWDYMRSFLVQSQPYVARADDLPVAIPEGSSAAPIPVPVAPLSPTVVQTFSPAPQTSPQPSPGTAPEPAPASNDGISDDFDVKPEDYNDPFEPINRVIFGFNEFFYQYILGPTSHVYKNYTPDFFQDMVGSLLGNLHEPLVLLNDLLQFEGERALVSAGRLVTNSVFGIGGLFDVAAKLDLEGHKEDLGQTFAVWGVGEGFYIVVPFLGPSNPRDILGQSVEGYFNPLNRWVDNTGRDYITYARSAASGIHLYSQVVDELDEIRETSVDYYATIRSLARQRRKSEILNGQVDELPPIPDMDFGIGAEGKPVPSY
ncbi:MAG: VacJ family lipoprotein [Rhodospirillaceae bacterium]|nr:VacJ family lipoprotein [Rhodospirillales bacterium]MBT3904426.1 VacJ family lipoprotein [Rhodospirillaceae bacterium]MBT4701208.1 VacJ family lipoprotein [Rhodospirillaceae bacterium]MBT5034342.1 VacJ family lipoprotein [Rhodospirillaceae bacterium]MBT6219976.1 VacJ family lipoprotein [Rhodospirillaceae bacterium]